MARRSGRTGDDRRARTPAAGRTVLNAPFADLGKHLRARPRAAPAPPPRPAPVAPPPPPPVDGPDLFASAMTGVVPLSDEVRARIAPPAPTTDGARRPVTEEAEAL